METVAFYSVFNKSCFGHSFSTMLYEQPRQAVADNQNAPIIHAVFEVWKTWGSFGVQELQRELAVHVENSHMHFCSSIATAVCYLAIVSFCVGRVQTDFELNSMQIFSSFS